MGTARTDEFRKGAVRIALTSGPSHKQIPDDLCVGISTLNKWITSHRDADVLSQEDRELALKNERLRRKNGIVVERIRKFKVEEGQKMIQGIIFPTTDRQRPHVQHRTESAGS